MSEIEEALEQLLTWPNPQGTIEQAYIPRWLADKCRAALAQHDAAAPTAAPPGDCFAQADAIEMLARSGGLKGPADAWTMLRSAIQSALAASTAAPVPVEPVALPRRGLVVLKNLVQILREQASFVDEEGDDTNALEELLEVLATAPPQTAQLATSDPEGHRQAIADAQSAQVEPVKCALCPNNARIPPVCDACHNSMGTRAKAAQVEPVAPARIERLKDAIEGECDGLAISDAHATAILEYVDAAAPPHAAQPQVAALEYLFLAIVTRADSDYLFRAVNRADEALRAAMPGWTPPVPMTMWAAQAPPQAVQPQQERTERERIAELVRSIHSTVSLGHQTGAYAYAGEDFGRYLREATEHCDEILECLAAVPRSPDAQAARPQQEPNSDGGEPA